MSFRCRTLRLQRPATGTCTTNSKELPHVTTSHPLRSNDMLPSPLWYFFRTNGYEHVQSFGSSWAHAGQITCYTWAHWTSPSFLWLYKHPRRGSFDNIPFRTFTQKAHPLLSNHSPITMVGSYTRLLCALGLASLAFSAAIDKRANNQENDSAESLVPNCKQEEYPMVC